MNIISHTELENYLNEILDCDAFELHSDASFHSSADAVQNFYIPYMMNDALECYLLLKNSHITGEYLPDFKGTVTAEVIHQPESIPAIIFRQGTTNVFTIWFEEACRVLKCYRYDQIGHFWVKGHEHWRRLVYIIGTMYDKFEYMGTQVCNEKEMALLPLMEFAPFRMYSPIHESLDAIYPESPDGLECITSLAKEVDDKEFLRLLSLYRYMPVNFMRKKLFQALNHPKRQKLYACIFRKIQEASSCYPERSWHPSLNAEIIDRRNQVTRKLQQHGFSGIYPLFHKDHMQILAMEEHPFTILEAKDFSFRIQFMVSDIRSKSSRRDSHSLNIGFFRDNNTRGWIETNLDFIS